MRVVALTLSILTLTACSQRDICESRATKDLRVVNNLVAEVQVNLARGYAIEEIERPVERRYTCDVEQKDGSVLRQICTDIDIETEERPVAIDLNVEAAKLRSLKVRQAELRQRTEVALAQCATLG